MPVITSIFLIISLVLAVLVGPQTRPWSWGPAMLTLGIAVLTALPVVWKRGKAPADFGMIAFATLVAAWFSWRAWISPVPESSQADLLLLCASVGTFVSIRSISGNARAENILTWGIALLLLANLVIIGVQIIDPTYSPIFRTRASDRMISGFFAHYNEAANYLICSSMLVGAASLLGKHRFITRIAWGLIALAGLAAVWFTQSRGGIMGAAVALGVFSAILLVIGKRRDARWFAPALIALPVIGLAIGAFWILGWRDAQNARWAGSGIAGLLDNSCRLYFLGIAMSCIALHPMAGGGSRSFSWECFPFTDATINGDIITRRPDMVHNEIVQSATDYGLIGAGLLLGFLCALSLLVILRSMFEETTKPYDSVDPWRLGGLAGFSGMMIQSCFSFVFHLLPGILLLGICLGQMSRSAEQSTNARTTGTRILISIAAVICAIFLLPIGWKGARVTRILWPSYFSKQSIASSESQIDALGEAIMVWPQSEFHQHRASILLNSTTSSEGAEFKDTTQRALQDYHEAALLQPFEPGYMGNIGTLNSRLQHDNEAEAAYAKAIHLQGGMEPAYRTRFFFANHYLAKGLRLFNSEKPEPALAALELAAKQIEISVKEMHWLAKDIRESRLFIHESLGTARESAGDSVGALECYDFATTLHGGKRAHYRAGVLIGRQAAEAWSKRHASEAMAGFIKAKQRILQAGNQLPQGVTPSQQMEYLDYLDRSINFLKGAKVEPTK